MNESFTAPSEFRKSGCGHFFEKAAPCRARHRKVRSAPVPPDGETSTRSLASPLPTQTVPLTFARGPRLCPPKETHSTLAPREVFFPRRRSPGKTIRVLSRLRARLRSRWRLCCLTDAAYPLRVNSARLLRQDDLPSGRSRFGECKRTAHRAVLFLSLDHH